MQKIYYSRETLGDILVITFSEKEATSSDEKDGVVVLKNGDEIVGVNILNFSKIARIFHEGEIIDPAPEFIEFVNHILKNAKVERLLS